MGRDIGSAPHEARFQKGIPPHPSLAATRGPDRELSTPASREREAGPGRHPYRLSAAEREALYDIGRFRTVAVSDLADHKYRGRAAEMRQDLRSLREQGLIQYRKVWTRGRGERLDVVVLTRSGKQLLEQPGNARDGQQVYAGFVKPNEVAHDAAIYPMYHAEAHRITQAGGHVRRILLDYELKRRVYSPLAKAKGLPPLQYARRQADIARQNGLTVVRGKIPLPDLRIEYETADGNRAHVDLELATEHYRGAQLHEKAAAGFKMYAPHNAAGRLSAVWDGPELVASILSL
jgi:hypothetical protein